MSRDRGGQFSVDLENGDGFTLNAADNLEVLARSERISGALFQAGRDTLTDCQVGYTMTPRAYVSGLVQYGIGSKIVSANFRPRWEWAPGSELFMVYTEDRNTAPLGDRWSELSTRGLVIKVTRLFRP